MSQPENFQIRPYRKADWPHLCAIHDSARRDELSASGYVAAFLTLEQTAQNEGLFDDELDVVEVGSAIRGFVAWSENEITWLYIDPHYYRRGIGRLLVRHVIDNAGPELSVEALEGNEAAIALYLSEGFSVSHRVSGRLDGNEKFLASGLILTRSRHDQPTPGKP